MKQFNDENFLLQSPTAERLYHDHAAKMPIIDYHCHLSPELVASDHRFRSLAEIWLDGDHYKWRAMRNIYKTGPPIELFLLYLHDIFNSSVEYFST